MVKASTAARRAVTILFVPLLMASGCGVADGLDRLQETIDESIEDAGAPADVGADSDADVDFDTDVDADADGWADYTSASGLYSIDFPTEPEYTEGEQDGLTLGVWTAEQNLDVLGITEFEVGPGETFDFERAAVGALEGSAAVIEQQSSGAVTYDIVSEESVDLDDNPGVRFEGVLEVDGDPIATFHGTAYRVGDTVISASMLDVDDDDRDDAERFLGSLRLLP